MRSAVEAAEVEFKKLSEDPHDIDREALKNYFDLTDIARRSSELVKRIRSIQHGNLKIFLSHSFAYHVNFGESVYDAAQRIALDKFSAQVITGGWKDSESDLILEDAQLKIDVCDIFIAVITPDKKGVMERLLGRILQPSPWLTLEVGIARALGKPMSIIISEGVSRRYYERVFSGIRMYHSEDLSSEFDRIFLSALNSAWRRLLKKRHEELNDN